MKAVLKNIGQGVDVSRIYIFLNESDQVVSNVFEWCATGVAPQIDHLQKINYDDIPSWRELLAQKGSICSNNIFDLPQDIIAGLEPQKIKALVVYPLYIEKKIAGFIGFDECRYQRTWQADELKLLQTISGIIANAYERKISQARLRESEDNFHAFFETMEDMLVVSDPSGQIIHANQSLIDKLAYRLPDLKEMTILDLYPEDFRDDAADLVDQVLNEEANFCPLAIVGKFGQTYAVESRIQIGKWNKKDCFFIILKDISQEKENLKLFSKVFVHNPLPMTITSMKDGKISKVNPAFLALDETKAGLWDFDLVHNTVFLSPMWKQILGYEDHEVENTIEAWGQFWHPDDLNPIQRSAGDYISGKLKASEIVNRLKHKDGSYRWILIRGGVLRDDKGTPTRWIGTNIDVTKEHEQALELERFFSVNLDLLCITDMEGNFIKTNKAWEDILGYPTAVLNKSNFLSFIHPDDLFTTLEAMKTLESGEKILHFVNRYLGASGNYRHIEWRSSPHGNLIYAAARDITKRIEYEEQLLELTNRDPLTNVYNRRFIYSRAEEIIEEHKRTRKLFSICIIDIDHFKKINDSYGHQAGDYILKAFTKIIADNLRPYDLLGRYGGEEFILILNHATKTQGYLIVERILKIMRTKPFICDGQSIPLTFSAGISDCREIDNLMVYNLVELADKRMYYAKQAGRNRIIFKDCASLVAGDC